MCKPTPSAPHHAPRSSQIRNATKYKGHTIYNPAKSSSAKEASGSWNISYGDGSSALGNVYSETVGNIAIPGQTVELAEKLSSSFLLLSCIPRVQPSAPLALDTVRTSDFTLPVPYFSFASVMMPFGLLAYVFLQL